MRKKKKSLIRPIPEKKRNSSFWLGAQKKRIKVEVGWLLGWTRLDTFVVVEHRDPSMHPPLTAPQAHIIKHMKYIDDDEIGMGNRKKQK